MQPRTVILHEKRNRHARRVQEWNYRHRAMVVTRRKFPTRFVFALYLMWWAFMVMGGVK